MTTTRSAPDTPHEAAAQQQPVPHFFGATSPLFGWFHPAVADESRDAVAVLCPAIGHEYVYAYRAYRVLAERLAASGIATLRFDYAGTGNASGTPHDAGQVAGWITSIHRAIDHARSASGRQNVVLIGLRMGATLAAYAAAERDDVNGIVLWNPCATGKAFIRQVKVLASTAEDLNHTTIDEETGDLEGLGFAFSPETVSDLSAMELASVSRLPQNLLLLSRDDMPLDATIASKLTELSAKATPTTFSDYATFMLPPIHSQLPDGAMTAIKEWLTSQYAVAPARPHHEPVDQTASIALGNDLVRERAEWIGDHALFGILTEPMASTVDAPTVLFLNTGGDHHIGPHRFYVPLARTLAARGVRSFRFDFSGLGDSARGVEGGDSYPPTAIDDIRAAVAHLRDRHGIDRIILVGLCSGGFYAVHAAFEDVPVAGIIAVNPQLYWREGDPLDVNPFWTEREANRIGAALLSPKYWGRALRGDVDYMHVAQTLRKRAIVLVRDVSDRIKSRLRTTDQRAASQNAAPHLPHTNSSQNGQGATGSARIVARKSRERNVMKLIRPSVDTHLVFSDKDTGLTYLHDNAGSRLVELEKRQSFTLSVVDGAGHTFMLQRMQRRLTGIMVEWLERHFPN